MAKKSTIRIPNLELHVLTGLLALSCLGAVSVFWKTPELLLLMLTAIAISIISIGGEKRRDAALFILVAAWGAISETVAIHFGAWSYPQPALFGIPYWLPLVWGIAGIFIKRLYQGIKECI